MPAMAHTYIANYIHMVFSAKNREDSIPDAPRIHQYLGGIARDAGVMPLAVGGTSDHVHMLMSLPATISIARAAQIVKGGSSRWIHESFADKSRFAWQEAYGAFSIGVSQIDATVEYIANQEQHHRRRDFRAELIAFLKKNRIAYDERYLLG
jgi:REP element-mobilizing transposase RayT